MKFEDLNIKPELVKALKEEGIVCPTTIQEKSIPIAQSGKDIVGISNTGSGKTVAFSIPVLEKVIPKKGLQVIVLAPTRELAVQISGEMRKFSKYLNISIATVFGGVAIPPQIKAIERSEVVVGTPGRMLDHLNKGNLDLSGIKCFVLDEADKMVEMGFIEDIRKMLDYTNKNRQIILFGATISDEINSIKSEYMHTPQTVKAELKVKEDLLEQYYYNVQQHEKFSLLVHLLKKENTERVIVFCSTRSTVDVLTANLRKQGIKAEMIHGQLSQSKRLSVIDLFNKGKVKLLVASAVAARGLDIKDVTHVFNYDLSQDPQEYIHRIGRTARAGESGKAITLLSRKDYDTFGQVLDRYALDVKELPDEQFEKLKFEVAISRNPRKPRFGNNSNFRGNTGKPKLRHRSY